jgi:hypothetical protein
VVESACSFLAMIQQAKQGWQIDHAASLNQLNGDGSEWLSGISGEDLALMQQLDEADVELPKGNIERLNAPGLSDIKFLTGKDARLASQFGQDPVLFELLPLSRIRLNLFGRHQAKIIGDLQNHNGAHISGLVNCDLVEKPGDWLDSVRELMSRVSQTRLACAHVLIQHNQSEALEILAEVLPENSRPAYRLIVDDELREYLYDQTTEWRKECEAAFRKNQRAGFKLLPGLDRAGDYAIGDGCLKQIQSQYERIKKHVVTYGQKTTDEKLEPCLSRFESDKVIFSRVFGEIYDSRVTLKKFQKQVV